MVEDLLIIQPDNSRACYNYETPNWRIIDPLNVCVWKELYQENINGKGTSFKHYEGYEPCAVCEGFDNACKRYFVNREE